MERLRERVFSEESLRARAVFAEQQRKKRMAKL